MFSMFNGFKVFDAFLERLHIKWQIRIIHSNYVSKLSDLSYEGIGAEKGQATFKKEEIKFIS